MSNNISQFVPILDGSNYGIWSSAMRAFLMSLGLWAHTTGTTATPAEMVDVAGAVTNQEACDKWFEKDAMAIGHLTLRVNPFIQQELDSLPATSFADDYWTHLSTRYGTTMPSSVYKDFKETLNIRLNPSQHPTQQIDHMVTAFQHLTATSIIIPPQIQAMILLSALPQKWEMLVSIVTQQHALTAIQLSHVCDAILAQYESENLRSDGKGKQQHTNKLSTVKRKRSNQNFSNQESGGSQQKPEDRLKRQRGGRGKGKKKEQGHAHTAQVSHITNVASLKAPTTTTIALPGPSGLQKRTVSTEKPKVRTPGPYKALNAALDKAQEDGVTPIIQTVKTLEQHITKQYEEGPWSRGDHTLGEEFDEDENVNMSVVPPSAEGQEDWVFKEASPTSPRDELLDWGSNADLKECVALPFLYPMFTKPPASLQCPSARRQLQDGKCRVAAMDLCTLPTVNNLDCEHGQSFTQCNCCKGKTASKMGTLWLLGSGASLHFTHDFNDFIEYETAKLADWMPVRTASDIVHI
jgi:hypothetical protein